MAKLIKIAHNKCICPTCDGNGIIRIATDDTSKDFRDHSKVHQCPTCQSEGEIIVANDQVTVADLKETIQ